MSTCVSVSEAAKIKKVTRQAIYLAIKLKRLKAYRHGDRWKVFLKDLQEYDEHRFSRVYHSTFRGEKIFNESRGMFSVDHASQRLGVDKQKVYYAIRSGKLRAIRRNAAWVISAADLLEYQSACLKNDCTAKKA